MNKAEHTPGPWAVQSDTGNFRRPFEITQEEVARAAIAKAKGERRENNNEQQ